MNIIKIKQFLVVVASLCLSVWVSADTYTYDNLNRLTTVSYTSGGTKTYSYDAAGNMLATISTPPAVSNYSLAVGLSGTGSGAVAGSGIDCGVTCTASLAGGATATLSATAANGSSFTGWGGACTGTGACVVNMTASTNVTASFSASSSSANLSLGVARAGTGSGTVASNPPGIDCGTTCTASFGANTNVTLTAPPAVGSAFAGWSGACTNTVGSCTVSMTAAQSVSATFVSNTNSVSMTSGWNLVGNGTQTVIDVAGSFGDAANVASVWKWNAPSSRWAFYSPALQGQALTDYAAGKGYDVLTLILSGEGFWVNARQAISLPIPTGRAVTGADFAATLQPGWNLIATGQTLTPRQFNDSLSITPPAQGSLASNIITLWTWDSARSGWYFYAPSLEAQGGTALTDYINSKGYLDFTSNNKTLGPGAGFWVNKP